MHISRMYRIRLVGEGALVGLGVGAVIALYRFLLSHAEEFMRAITQALLGAGVLVVAWFAVLALICLVVDRLMVFEPYTQASGIPQIDAEVAGRIHMPWHRVVPAKLVEGVLCAFAGLSLGREGPSVLLGGMTAKGVSKLVARVTGAGGSGHERLLVTCGAAAGMSAAFHAPLTGVLFAVEEIHKEFSTALIISVMTSSVVADFVSSQLLGESPVIHVMVYQTAPHSLYPAVLLMGVVCGLLGFVHNRGMFFVQDRLYGPFERHTPFVRMALPFLLAGVIAFVWPDLLCGGDAILEHLSDVRTETLATLCALLVGKYVFTALCFGSGAPGGTLFPLVVMGALVGAIYGICSSSIAGVPDLYVNGFVVLGVAGLFSAVIQAPVTAVVLVFELTGSLEALLATSVVSIVAFVVSTLLKNDAFYEHLYARLIGGLHVSSAGERYLQGHQIIRNHVVGVGSAADGRLVRDVSWPEGALVVTMREAGKKKVVAGDTRITALSELSVVMDEVDELKIEQELKRLLAPEG